MALPRTGDSGGANAALVAVPTGRALAVLRRSLLGWFDTDGRSLAFRAPGVDPWGVLVAEVMAQQTQVVRVEPAWRAFLERYPDSTALAAASPADAIRAWRGLGYNRRALDLHRAACAMVDAGGTVPTDPAALEALPGIGPYTARAVAAIAFGRPVGAVDVNVRRVLGRLVTGDPAGLSRRQAQAAANRLADRRRPGDWAHALMDLGATVCRPASPDCPICPLRRWCRAGVGRGTSGTRSSIERRRPRSTAAPVRFEATARWLRGRLVDRLRDAPPGAWISIRGPLGEHPAAAVGTALRGLAADGLVELDRVGRARLPVDRRAPGDRL